MKKLEFKIDIHASKEKVWETMLNPVTYKEWVNVSWPGSYYEGEWKEDENVKFISPGQGGTMAKLDQVELYKNILAKHIAVINADGSEDRESDVAKGWIGTTESYSFSEEKGITTLSTEMNTNAAWVSMFEEGWPHALAKLKEICERSN